MLNMGQNGLICSELFQKAGEETMDVNGKKVDFSWRSIFLTELFNNKTDCF